VWGFIWGLLAGALVGLFSARRSGPETRRELSRSGQALVSRIEETVTPPDPVAESMAAGKAAARRRRADLGLVAKP
jgi:gas vesicle protein